jgi:hypothetical protein
LGTRHRTKTSKTIRLLNTRHRTKTNNTIRLLMYLIIKYRCHAINVRENRRRNPECTISQRHMQHWGQDTERRQTKQSPYWAQDTE